ncbi:MAG: hypothetical protein F7B60_03885 [Desulfurococcales archaeon]|nr:hypothetical protein [Desulfurococcales archaeon]
MLDALVINNKCQNAVVCNSNERTCYLPNGNKLGFKVISSVSEIENISLKEPAVLYFPDSKIAYDTKKKTGYMTLELLNDRLGGYKDIIIAGLHVMASWEFNILAGNDWGYIYLPIDASISGDFVPLYELDNLGVRVALGSGFFDSRFGVCDFPIVVWSAFLNQYNLLREEKAITGVWRATLGGWKVYHLDEPEGITGSLIELGPEEALDHIYLFARKKSRFGQRGRYSKEKEIF